MSQAPWHSFDLDALRTELKAESEGLSSQEALVRLNSCGPNEIPKGRKVTLWELIWTQINSPLIWVLVGAAVLAIVTDPSGGIKNGLVIFSVILVNTFIGTLQEAKARRAIEALDQLVPEKAVVCRDGTKVEIDASGLVPGDWIYLASGDRVPADARLVFQKGLLVEEAALTGESLPAEKSILVLEAQTVIGDQTNMVFAGTMVVSGTGSAIVTSTGLQTQIGLISAMLRDASTLETPLTHALAKLGKSISLGIIGLAVVMLRRWHLEDHGFHRGWTWYGFPRNHSVCHFACSWCDSRGIAGFDHHCLSHWRPANGATSGDRPKAASYRNAGQYIDHMHR